MLLLLIVKYSLNFSIFTNYHCVPPQASVFNKFGDKTRLNIQFIHARTDNNPSEVAYELPDTLPLELVTRVNSASQHHPIYDPVNGKVCTSLVLTKG